MNKTNEVTNIDNEELSNEEKKKPLTILEIVQTIQATCELMEFIRNS